MNPSNPAPPAQPSPILIPSFSNDSSTSAPLAYLGAGLRVVGLHGVVSGACTCPDGPRCKRAGKHPLASFYKAAALSWTEGLTKTQAYRLWQGNKAANVGLIMGGPLRLVALDIDGDDGVAQLAAFEAEHGPLPTTATQRTGSGGEHRLFTVPPHLNMGALSNRVGVSGRSASGGLDVRTEGGQIVVEPSLHPSGHRYQWTCRGPVAELPESLFHRLTQPPERPLSLALSASTTTATATATTAPKAPPSLVAPEASAHTLLEVGQGAASETPASAESTSPPPVSQTLSVNRPGAFERARMWLATIEPAVQGQNGSAQLMRAAVGLVRGFSLSDDEALALLWQDYNPRCQPPWKPADKDGPAHKVRDARNKGKMAWGHLLDQEGTWRNERSAAPGRPRPSGESTASAPGASSEPLPAFDPLPTSNDLPRFPVELLPAPVAAFVEQLASYLEAPPDLPAVLALGVLASLAMRRYAAQPRAGWLEPLNLYAVVALDPGERKSPAFRRVLAPLYEHQAQLVEEWQGESKRIAAINAARQRGEDLEPVPPRPRLFVDDATPEKLARVLAQHGERITMASDEGGVFQMMTGLYSKSGAVNVGVYLKAHDGGRLAVDRMSHEAVHLNAPLMTMLLAVQPEIIRSLAKRPDLRGIGLWARFAYSLPASLVGHRTFTTPDLEPAVQDGWRELVLAIARQTRPSLTSTANSPGSELVPLRFSPQAWERLRLAMVSIDGAVAPGGPLVGVRDWASKLSGLVVRLAGLLHIASELVPESCPIGVEVVERALALGKYFLAHARQAFEVEMTLDPSEQAARQAWEVIQRRGLDRVTPGQLGKWARGCRRTEDAVAALNVLVRQGCLVHDTAHHGKAYRVRTPREVGQGGGSFPTTPTENRRNTDAVTDGSNSKRGGEILSSSSSSPSESDDSDARMHACTHANPPPEGGPPGDPFASPVGNVGNVGMGVLPDVSGAVPSAAPSVDVGNEAPPGQPLPAPGSASEPPGEEGCDELFPVDPGGLPPLEQEAPCPPP